MTVYEYKEIYIYTIKENHPTERCKKMEMVLEFECKFRKSNSAVVLTHGL